MLLGTFFSFSDNVYKKLFSQRCQKAALCIKGLTLQSQKNTLGKSVLKPLAAPFSNTGIFLLPIEKQHLPLFSQCFLPFKDKCKAPVAQSVA